MMNEANSSSFVGRTGGGMLIEHEQGHADQREEGELDEDHSTAGDQGPGGLARCERAEKVTLDHHLIDPVRAGVQDHAPIRPAQKP